MALSRSLSVLSPSLTFQFPSLFHQKFTSPHKKPFHNRENCLPLLSCSSPKAASFTEQEVLNFLAESNEKTLPCVRTYENDLARLSLVGAVAFDQALTAAAADGGEAAAEHIDSGVPAMVVETVFPGHTDEHATVSTRLFLPARKVKEKAVKLRKSLSDDLFSGASSRNILAMTFRQVVLQKLWNFELVLFRPGPERDMENLEDSREVPVSFAIHSSDERVISVLAEVVCISALQNTEKNFLDDFLGRTSSNFFNWLQKPGRIASKDSSVVIYKLFEDEIIENANDLIESFDSTKHSLNPIKIRPKNYWWTLSAHSKLEKLGGPGFSAWTCEYVPAYRLEIDANILNDVKLEGWRKSSENRWEVLLTHSQMVGLADVLDMFYEDIYSLPNKQLQCGLFASYTNLSNKKRNSSLLKILSLTLASGILLVSLSALNQFCFPHLHKGGKYPGRNRSPPSSEIQSTTIQSLDTEKSEAFCMSIVQKIRDAFGSSGDVMIERDLGAWIGEIPTCLKLSLQANSISEDKSSNSAYLEKIDADLSSLQDVATYQVVMTTEGNIVGFQPTNRVGVNNWAANPLAKELYGGKKLSPGFVERGLNIHLPGEVVVIELLMSVNSDSCFALARPTIR